MLPTPPTTIVTNDIISAFANAEATLTFSIGIP